MKILYDEVIELRNRLSPDGSGETYQEDHLLLDRVLDLLEELLHIEMTKKYLIIYENNDGDIFKKVYDGFVSKKEALAYFKENNTKYGYKVIAIREVTSNNIYL